MLVWSLVIAALVALLLLLIAVFVLARSSSPESRRLSKRIMRLPWRAKLRLARRLMTDPAIPLWIRAIPPALVLYLAMPVDIIPDFIPVLGQLDDVLVLVVGVGLLLRLVPPSRLEAALAAAEGQQDRGDEP